MPQKLNITPDQLQQAKSNVSDEMIPTLEGAKNYFAYAHYNGTPILCIFDNDNWRPTTRDEMMKLIM